ncbi:MAG: GNAT family N-acetyltransferase [Clostridiales bacterium]|jgi:GNAT superfamily N-acetyltransferase|nr:GNAT family N-acetyltransferase [Clostridiales bacterium]
MNAKLTFREATREDCALILALIKELAVYEKLEDQVVATPEILEEWIFDKQSAWVIFPMVDGKEVGYAIFCQNFSTFLGRAGMYLEDIYVRPEYRGQGIGKATFVQLVKIAKERGYGRMEWVCLDWNTPSIEFYLKLGAEQLNDWTTYRLTRDDFDNILN